MGFKSDKAKVLEDLENLNFDHEARSGRVEEENLLAAGVISPEEAAEIVAQSRGNDYESRPHHQVKYPPVWILTPLVKGTSWYVKGYFLADQTWFISFHPSNS